MGTLYYGDARLPIEIEDRALAHVKLVVLAKLRRGEGFGFSWQYGTEGGGGRSTVWINPSVALQFEFDGSRQPLINRAWLEALTIASSSNIGLSVQPEPPDTSTGQIGVTADAAPAAAK
jgi:hypothetical protein